ncbi:MAG: hypothetical protein ACREXY_09030 [Gammaproteobacteria bacterium]
MSARQEKQLKRWRYRRRARQRVAERRRREWFANGKISIPGVTWELPDHVRGVCEAVQHDLGDWALGLKDIPALRHVKNDRLMHAVGRKSMSKVLLALTPLTDYRTQNVGTPYLDPGAGQCYWGGRSIQYIANVAGVSYWAAKRCLQGLVGRGAMTLFEQAGTNEQGVIYGRPSVRNLALDILKCIGNKTWKAVQRARQIATDDWKEAHEAVQGAIEAAERLRYKVKGKAVAAVEKATEKIKDAVAVAAPPEVRAALRAMLDRNNLRKPDTS